MKLIKTLWNVTKKATKVATTNMDTIATIAYQATEKVAEYSIKGNEYVRNNNVVELGIAKGIELYKEATKEEEVNKEVK